jgi:3',5'-cyclic AMP phosphodiesterase CpdA
VLLAHISDLHIGHDPEDRALDRARRVVDRLNALPGEVDAVLVTGDLADHGTAEEYRGVRDVLAALRFPALICPGNHDVREAYREVLLAEPAAPGPVNQVHRVAGYTIAMCDSSIPGRADGHLDDETLAWLDGVLTETDDPALVCFHHPPVRLGIPWLDDIRQHGAARLADLLAGHPHVRAVLCGHAHTAAASTFADRPLLVAPGVVSTMLLPFESHALIDYDLAPAIAFHVFAEDNPPVTHFRTS